MFQRRLVPRGVPAHQPVDLGRRRDLISDIPHHSERRHRPIGQERPQEPDGPHLHREPDPVVITTPYPHTLAVRIVQEEEPLQLRAARLPVELP